MIFDDQRTLTLTALQFIDLCILLGCDYLEPIKGVGPKSALKLIREHGDLAAVVEYLKEKSVVVLFKLCPVDLLLVAYFQGCRTR